MTTHYIKANILKAVSLCANKDETRYYLNGVYVEANGGIVATDNHTMAAYGLEKDEPAGPGFIIKNDDVKKILAIHKAGAKSMGKIPVVIRLTLIAPNAISCATVVQIKGEDDKVLSSFETAPINGAYPDFRRVIPCGDDRCGDFSVNMALLSRFGEAARLITGEKTEQVRIIRRAKMDAIEVRINDDKFLGIIMPMRR